MRAKLTCVAMLTMFVGAACGSDTGGTTSSPSPSATASAPAPAATVDMLTSSLVFRPESVSIKVGDTVLWRNTESAPHTVTSTTNAWADSGTINKDGTFSHTFDAAGTFDYKCTVHPAMTGKVVVT